MATASQQTPPPEAVRTFQIKTIRHVLGKLEWEIEQLQNSQFSRDARAVDISSYLAINAALTAFHACEWIWHLGTQKQRDTLMQAAPATSKAKGKARFQVGLKQKCPEFGVCREIANSFKHLTDDDFTDKAVMTDVPLFEMSIPATAGMAKAGDPLVQYGKILMVRCHGVITPVAHVLTKAHAFLEEFLAKP